MDDRTNEEFISAQEACALLGIKPATLYAYVSRGGLHSYRQGARRQRLYRRSQLNALRVGPGAPGESAQVELPDAESWVGER
jgi:citrate synthase